VIDPPWGRVKIFMEDRINERARHKAPSTKNFDRVDWSFENIKKPPCDFAKEVLNNLVCIESVFV
jgi:hypothetical protein